MCDAAPLSITHTYTHHHGDDVVLGKFSRPMDGPGVRLCEYMSFGLRQVFFELRSRQIVTRARHLELPPGWKLGWGNKKTGKTDELMKVCQHPKPSAIERCFFASLLRLAWNFVFENYGPDDTNPWYFFISAQSAAR